MNHSLADNYAVSYLLQLTRPSFLIDSQGHIRRVNAAMERLCGLPNARMADLPLLSLVHPYDRSVNQSLLRRLWCGERDELRQELCLMLGHGRLLHVQMEGILLRNPGGEQHCVLASLADLSGRPGVALHERRAALKFYHRVTGWAFPPLFRDRVQQVLRQSRYRRQQAALMLLGFGQKHQADQLEKVFHQRRFLVKLMERLEALRRPDSFLGHYGHNQLGIVVEEAEPLHLLADWVQEVLETSRNVIAGELPGASIRPYAGLALFPGNGGHFDELATSAALALHKAGQDLGAGFHFSDADTQALTLSRLERHRQLQQAIRNGELILFYQPVFDLRRRKIQSVEALIRWQHPTRGLLLPADFLADLEHLELLREIGQQILVQACSQAREWRRTMPDLRLSINTFPQLFLRPDFPNRLDQALAAADLPPEALQLEITEETLVAALRDTPQHFDTLRHRGVRIAIDDYGSGASSLSQLHRADIQTLKIDGRMIGTLPACAPTAAMASAILDTARHCNFDVVAEGVETAEQFHFLQKLDCQQLQGYYLARPMPAEHFTLFDGKLPVFH